MNKICEQVFYYINLAFALSGLIQSTDHLDLKGRAVIYNHTFVSKRQKYVAEHQIELAYMFNLVIWAYFTKKLRGRD